MFNRSPLLTDQYCLTMSQSFFWHDQNELCSFEMFVRSLPKNRGYLVVAGIESLVEYLENLHFSDEDLAHLRSMGIYKDDFLDFLKGFRFTGKLRAIPEGTIISNQIPIVTVTAPRIECSIIESALLSIINHQTMIASKFSRVVDAAQGRQVWDFSLRRLHGPEASMGVAHAAYIAGAAGTATVEAGKQFGIPTTGTLAHQFIMSFGRANEQTAFEQFLSDYPDGTSLLVDTYDTLEGTRLAIAASKATGVHLKAIRLDSGDLGELAKGCRVILDEAGFHDTKIMASNDLDEWKIEKLLLDGAPIDIFGCGTMPGTSADAPALSGVFKAVSTHYPGGKDQYYMKLAPGKQTDPGLHQVFRRNGIDTIGMHDEQLDGTPLLEDFMIDGERVRENDSYEVMRARAQEQRDALPIAVRQLTSPENLSPQRSEQLWKLRESLGDIEAAAHTITLQDESSSY